MRRLTCAPNDAYGALLARAVASGGCRLPKGKALGKEEIARLNRAGVTKVAVIQVGLRDLLGAAAVNKILHRLRGSNVLPVPAGALRGRLVSTCAGIADYDQRALGGANLSCTALRAAAIAPPAAVKPGQLCAIARAREPVLDAAQASGYCALLPQIAVHPFRAVPAALVHVRRQGANPKLAGRRLISAALAATGCPPAQVICCEPAADQLAGALEQARRAQLIVFALDDRRIHTALRRALTRAGAALVKKRQPRGAEPLLAGMIDTSRVAAVSGAPDAELPAASSLLLKIAATDLALTGELLGKIAGNSASGKIDKAMQPPNLL